MKLDIRIVYGKSELQPQEIKWLSGKNFIRTSYCPNLHAKCYMNENAAIITSMNLYEFSQVNNHEMGVYIERDAEPELYRETYEEAQRLIRVSEEIRLGAETVEKVPEPDEQGVAESEGQGYGKLSTSRLARERKTTDLPLSCIRGREAKEVKLRINGFNAGAQRTAGGRRDPETGGEFPVSKRFGPYFLWPVAFAV